MFCFRTDCKGCPYVLRLAAECAMARSTMTHKELYLDIIIRHWN